MAKASLNELPNQQLTTQNQPPKIPHPRTRSKTTKTIAPQYNIRPLFAQEVPSANMLLASQYIESTITTQESIKVGSFLITLLEKLGSIPHEISAEDAEQRAEAVTAIEDLVIELYDDSLLATDAREQAVAYVDTLEAELKDFKNSDDTLNNSRFQELVVNEIGRENIATYPIFILLRDAVKKVRNIKKRSLEPQINTVQQLAILGIAKQLRSK